MNHHSLYQIILEHIDDGVYFVDKERKIGFWNKGAERITGYTEKDTVGNFCYNNMLNHVDEDGNLLCFTECPLTSAMETNEIQKIPVYLHHKNGYRVAVAVRTIPVFDDGEMIGVIEMFNRETETKELFRHLEELEEFALQDDLTKLPNRRYIDSYMEAKYAEHMKHGDSIGLAFLDIDHFRNFNNKYGHAVGDKVLKMVSATLKRVTRSQDFVGRWGGEEFLIVFSGVSEHSLYSMADRIRTMIELSGVKHGKEELHVTVSIGVTALKAHDTLATLLERADILLYQSKEEGRNRVTCDCNGDGCDTEN